jgi:fucose 4-O-acetylase-like acetyltransferase
MKRIKWLDVARGFGIILVILGHQSIPDSIKIHIYSFHMPLFFIVSGFLLSFGKEDSFNKFLGKKAKSILWPYLYISILSWLYWLLIGRNFGADSHLNVEWWVPLLGTLYGSDQGYFLVHNYALWFLPCLFLSEIIFYFAMKLRVKLRIVVFLITGIMGYALSIVNLSLPWSADTAFSAILLIGFGYLIGKREANTKRRLLSLIPFLILASLVSSSLNGRVDMNSNSLGNPFLFYIGAISGSLIVLLFSKQIGSFRPLDFIGRESLFFFGFSGICTSVFKGIIFFALGINLEHTQYSLCWGLIYTIGTLSLLTLAVFSIRSLSFRFIQHKKSED